MNTTSIIPIAEGTPIRYSYAYRGETVVVEGRKGQAINPGRNGGFEIVSESGEVVARITRYAKVEVTA
jgi:hypothetical protein